MLFFVYKHVTLTQFAYLLELYFQYMLTLMLPLGYIMLYVICYRKI